MKSVLDFQKKKQEKEKITMITCYDYTSARILSQTSADCLLVGDSVAMTMHGYPSTVHADIPMMKLHTEAVARGAADKFIVADMPFLSFRKGIPAAMECVDVLMKAGAGAIKLEGVRGHEDLVRAIVQSGVPVMGHIGLTPQSIHGLGGFKVQGRSEEAGRELLEQAKLLQELGCFSLVLECIPSDLGSAITSALKIPTIGIGAGSSVDGQVLVYQDLLGMNSDFKPKFVRNFLEGEQLLRSALDSYCDSVRTGAFPTEKESYA